MAAAPNPGIHCTAVPDGFEGSGKLRLSLVLTPDDRTPPLGHLVSLREWPRDVAGLGSHLVITLQNGVTGSIKHLTGHFVVDDALASDPGEANKLWHKIFFEHKDLAAPLRAVLAEAHESDPDPALADSFSAQNVEQRLKDVRVSVHRHKISIENINRVQTSYLSNAFDTFHDDSQLLKFLALAVAHEMRLAEQGKSSIDVGSFSKRLAVAAEVILESTAADWISSIAAGLARHPFRERLLAGVQSRTLRELLNAGIGVPPSDGFGSLDHLLLARAASRSRTEKFERDRKNAVMDVVLKTAGKAADRFDEDKDRSLDGLRQAPQTGRSTMRAFMSAAAQAQVEEPVLTVGMKDRLELLRDQIGKNFEAFHRHWRNSPVGVREVEEAIQAQSEADAARRKLFGIRAQPTLAKFLRLIVDVEIDAAQLTDGYGLITAWFARDRAEAAAEWSANPDKAEFTAYDLKHSEDASVRRFRPCAGQDYPYWATPTDIITQPPIKNGVIDLQAKYWKSSQPRFGLAVLDMASAFNALRMKAEQDAGAERDGTLLDSISTKNPERQSRGLQLLDRQAPDQMTADLFRRQFIRRPGTKRPFCAEDLTIGYRPFVQRWAFGTTPVESDDSVTNGTAWRSLVARHVRYDDIPKKVSQSNAYRRVRSRDHGLVRPAHKVQSDGQQANSNADASSEEQLFAWMGASLALSTDLRREILEADKDHDPGQNPATDLAIGIEYDFSNEDQDKQPALRVGDSYLLGLAPVYPNGGGPTFSEVSRSFNRRASAAVVLGVEGSVQPFRFGPPRDIPAPVVLLSEDEAKAWRKVEAQNSENVSNAEHVERIVVRTANAPAGNKDVARRYLVPTRTSFERAEQSGMFDKVHGATPHGAFVEYELHAKFGSFVSDDPLKMQKSETARPNLLRLRGSGKQPQAPYYPDPSARNLIAAFNRAGAVPVGFPEDCPPRAFWKATEPAVNAKPIELLIRRWERARVGGRFDFDDNKGTVTGGGTKRSIDRLTIELAPAEDVMLMLWCAPDGAQLLKSRPNLAPQFRAVTLAFVTELMAAKGRTLSLADAQRVENVIAKVAEGIPLAQARASAVMSPEWEQAIERAFAMALSALLMRTPDNGLNTWVTLELVHAVEKPLSVPAIPKVFRDRIIDGQRRKIRMLGVQPVRVRANTKWEDYAAHLQPANPLEALDLPSQPDGTAAYFVGQIEFDRPSSGEVRLEASWLELNPAVTIVKEGDKYRYRPQTRDWQLFDPIKVPPDRGVNSEGHLDLTFNETGALRGCRFPFTDTAARELSFRLVATSRFTNDFPETRKKAVVKDALGRFEKESRPPAGSDRLRDAPEDSYEIYKVMLNATSPPPVPVVGHVDWVMPEELTEFQHHRRICVEKGCYPRLYLGRDWKASGEHELFAVVCAPGDLVANRPYSPDAKSPPVLSPIALNRTEAIRALEHRAIRASAFTKGGSYEAVADFVTRWGSDPTTRSGALTGTITRERFSGFIAAISDFPLPSDPSRKVSLLLYRPKFDETLGEFYVEIGLDPGPAHAPVVQLAIARYQPYVSDPRFHLSSIVQARPLQITPLRKVEVVINDRHVTAIVQGVGYTNRNPEVPEAFGTTLPPDYLSWIRHPLQNVRVIRLPEGRSGGGLQVHDAGGRPLRRDRVSPQFFHPEMIWIAEFNLPTPSRAYRYGIELNEVDLHFADEAYEENAARGVGEVERPSRFSLTIDLEQGLFAPAPDETPTPEKPGK